MWILKLETEVVNSGVESRERGRVPEFGGIRLGEEFSREFADVGLRVELHVEAFGPVHDGLIHPGVGAIAERGLGRAVDALLDLEWKLEHLVRLGLAALDERLVHAVVDHLEEPEPLARRGDVGHESRARRGVGGAQARHIDDRDDAAGRGSGVEAQDGALVLRLHEHGRQRLRLRRGQRRKEARVPLRRVGA